MQIARTIVRKGVTVALDAARMPVGVVTRLLPGGDGDVGAKLTGALDQADAAARQVAGAVLRDPELQADGRRRQLAVTERLHAADLRTEAAEAREAAQDRATASFAEAEERRARVRQAAEDERAAAEEQRAERLAAQEHAAEVRQAEVDERRRAAQQKVEKKAKRAKLAVLDDQVSALDTQEDALVAADEAARLRDAATAAKAARKRT